MGKTSNSWLKFYFKRLSFPNTSASRAERFPFCYFQVAFLIKQFWSLISSSSYHWVIYGTPEEQMDLTGQNPAWQQKMAYISGTCDCYSQEEYQLVDLYFVNLLGKKPNWANRY